MIFVSFNINTTGFISKTESSYPSEALKFIPVFKRVCGAQSITFYVMLCQPLSVSLSFFSFGDCIFSPSSLYGSASDYPLVSSNFSNYSFHANQNKFFVRKHNKKVTERDMSLAYIDSSQRGPRK